MGQTDGFAASPLEVRQAAKQRSHLLFKFFISARMLEIQRAYNPNKRHRHLTQRSKGQKKEYQGIPYSRKKHKLNADKGR